MISVKTLEKYELKNIEEFFDMILSSYVNGQKTQAKNQLSKLGYNQRVQFMNYLHCEERIKYHHPIAIMIAEGK